MSGAIPPLYQYAFMAWCSVKKSTGTTLPLRLIRKEFYEINYLLITTNYGDDDKSKSQVHLLSLRQEIPIPSEQIQPLGKNHFLLNVYKCLSVLRFVGLNLSSYLICRELISCLIPSPGK